MRKILKTMEYSPDGKKYHSGSGLGITCCFFAGNNEKKNVEQKDLENLHIGQKRSTFNAVAKEVVIAQEISAPKKKSVIYTRKEGNMPLGGLRSWPEYTHRKLAGSRV